MATKTIKDVSEKTWTRLRVLSAEHNIKMGRLLEKITEDYEKRSREFWNLVFEGEKILTDKEAEDMEAIVKSLREERGFR